MLLCETNHVLESDYSEVIVVGAGTDAIHQSGKWYTNEKINQMLMERHLIKMARRGSHKNHIKRQRKRTEDADVQFAQSFEKLIAARRINYHQERAVWKPTNHAFPQTALTYLGNVMNTRAASFYQEHGVQQIAGAYEKERVEDAVLMFCKHCLRYSMGWCPIHQRVRSPYREPYFLVSNDGKRFRLEFDCKNCQMKVKAAQ